MQGIKHEKDLERRLSRIGTQGPGPSDQGKGEPKVPRTQGSQV